MRPAAEQAREVSQDLDAAAADSILSTAEDQPPATDRARRREEIHRLADDGFAAAEIARRVGSPVGEVELILSLRGSE